MRDSHAAVLAHLDWMRQRGLSPGTISYRQRLLTRLAAELPRPVLKATAKDLQRWRAGLTVSPATVLHYVSHARSFYAWAVQVKLIQISPAALVPTPRISRGVPRPIAEDNLMAALASAPERIRPWLVLAGWAGLRAKEIAFLRGQNVMLHLDIPVILIAADATKGRKERVVPLSLFVVEEMMKAGMPARGWLFRRYDGKPGPNAPWVISQLSNEHLHACGMTDTLHSLRHRFASQAYQASKDLQMVGQLLGHSNLATTAIYADWDRSAALPAVEALPVPHPRLGDGNHPQRYVE